MCTKWRKLIAKVCKTFDDFPSRPLTPHLVRIKDARRPTFSRLPWVTDELHQPRLDIMSTPKRSSGGGVQKTEREQRTYRACTHCRQRKSRCIFTDTPGKSPCTRCEFQNVHFLGFSIKVRGFLGRAKRTCVYLGNMYISCWKWSCKFLICPSNQSRSGALFH